MASRRQAATPVIDDRGAPGKVIAISRLRTDPRMADARFAAVYERAVRLTMSGYRMGLQVAICLAAGGVFAVLSRWLGMRSPPGVTVLATVAVSVALTIMLWRWSEMRSAPRLAVILVEAGLCPTCSYTLADLPLETDGCRVCPECGAAWRADRMRCETRYVESGDIDRTRGYRTFWRDGIGLGATSVIDDAGVRRPLVSARLKREIAASSGPRGSRLKDTARRNTRSGAVLRTALFLLYSCLAVAAWTIGAKVLPGIGGKAVAIAGGIVCAAFAFALWKGCAGVASSWVKKQMLASGLCPSCSADLRLLPRELNVCESCGASWRGPP